MGSIFNPIDDAVAWIITHIYNVLGPIFGPASGLTWVLSIVFLVVLMRLIMVPLFIKQMHTQRAMTALTPKITELRKKYKGDKETLNAETMKLYQEAGVNPLMGCLPVVLQMPIFFALFSVLRQIADWTPKQPGGLKYHLTIPMVNNAHHAYIFGATIADKFFASSVSVKVVIGAAVLLSMGTTYLTMRQSMKRGMMPTGSDSPMGQSQKMMVYIMPLFALTGLIWPFGLVLYWVTTNLWTLGQQYVLLRRYPIGAAAMGPDGNKPIGGTAGTARPSSGAGGTTGSKAAGGGGKTGDARTAGGKPGSAGSGGRAANSNGRPASAGSGKPAGTGGGKARPGSPAAGRPAADGIAGAGSANGHGSAASNGGVLRRFGKGRSEPEAPAPVEPEVKLVRQQRQRQSRSKRSGKR
ncbi:MAG TPA: membrane protein insertase YidC [Streptosporangiaceae bacterium]|nr:membrane protein insertase YidC [Streptosporangiaceae bacterium]